MIIIHKAKHIYPRIVTNNIHWYIPELNIAYKGDIN